MGIVLKVTPEVLTSMAGEVEKKITDIENQFRSIEEDITKTRTFWEGDASEKHQTLYNEQKESISVSLTRLKENPGKLLEIAGIHRETEVYNVNESTSLVQDVIV